MELKKIKLNPILVNMVTVKVTVTVTVMVTDMVTEIIILNS